MLISVRRLSQFKKALSWYSGLVKPGKPPTPPYSHVVQIGDPVLREVCQEVPRSLIDSPHIQHIVTRMMKVMRKTGCVGLSAPQIGAALRIMIIEFNSNHMKDYSDLEKETKELQIVPMTVIVNPVMKVIDYERVVFGESCASVRGFLADVPRYKKVLVTGYDDDGEDVSIESNSGWLSRIIQHEMDHLDGKLFTDKMDRRTLSCSCWEAVNERRGKVELPYY